MSLSSLKSGWSPSNVLIWFLDKTSFPKSLNLDILTRALSLILNDLMTTCLNWDQALSGQDQAYYLYFKDHSRLKVKFPNYLPSPIEFLFIWRFQESPVLRGIAQQLLG